MNPLRQRFGRPLRLGVIGGGPESWIGQMHRGAAEFDGWWRVCAGVFSSDAARSQAAGPLLGIDASRSYGTVAEMLRAEAQRADPIEAVAIMTPNDTHHVYAAAALDAGLDVAMLPELTDVDTVDDAREAAAAAPAHRFAATLRILMTDAATRAGTTAPASPLGDPE